MTTTTTTMNANKLVNLTQLCVTNTTVLLLFIVIISQFSSTVVAGNLVQRGRVTVPIHTHRSTDAQNVLSR